MSVLEFAKYLGKGARWCPRNGIEFAVVIKDVKPASYNEPKFKIVPVAGSGSCNVIKSSLTKIEGVEK